MPMTNSPIFRALNRETALATRLVSTGVTAIRKATYAQTGIYIDAFFGLSLGLERLAKLAIVLDHCLQNNGAFPTEKNLRSIGHDILQLWTVGQGIRARYPTQSKLATAPSDLITMAILGALSDFARGSRYYNVDYLVSEKSLKTADPLSRWSSEVSKEIIAKHRDIAKNLRSVEEASKLGSLLDQFTMVHHESIDGTPIRNTVEGIIASNDEQFALKWAQLYCLRIIRFWSQLLIDLHYESRRRQIDFIPHMSDHLGMFCNEDKYFKSRKTWLSP